GRSRRGGDRRVGRRGLLQQARDLVSGARGEGCAGEEDRRQREADREAPRCRDTPPGGGRLGGRGGCRAVTPLRGVELGLDDRLALAVERCDEVAGEREDEQTDEEPPAAVRFPFHDGLAPIPLGLAPKA